MDLNYGMKKAPFMSWTRYKEIWKEKANYKNYLRDKSEFEKAPDEDFGEYDELIKSPYEK